ncbi:MAG TPA: glycosyltransferase family 39 protein [Pyrinomonadaceae bacterium]|nr:glycosyltransferase family 39 protein [Pyrinomonadaceae bacterium]
MLKRRKKWFVFLALLAFAATFRIAVAHWLPNDAPDDGRVYAQIARNVLEQHVYSHETEAPYDPTLIRLPGYPLFLAAIYKVFGHGNNGAVRIVQALIDTAMCALIALLAFYWEPDEERKRATAIAALALAAVCPFTTIYAATILTEVPTTFLVMAMCLAATLAFQAERWKRSLTWWIVSGLFGGMAVLLRPDSGLFAAAVGLTLVITGLIWSAPAERSGDGALDAAPADKSRSIQSGVALRLPPHSKNFSRTVAASAVFSLAFVLVLVPWTIRNARVFHLFQPLATAHGEMPNEFVARGYYRWLRTWLDDERYIGPFLWSLDSDPIALDDVPPQAFDSEDEENRVAALLEKYNHPDGSQTVNSASQQPQPSPTPQASPTQTPPTSARPIGKPTPDSTQKNSNTNANSNAEDTGDESDQNDNSGDQVDENDNPNESAQSEPEPHGPVKMTPEIDAGFAQIARERIARHPFRFYVWLPIARAETMWFDTHSQYWPFEGDLLPLEDLDYAGHQHIWLPLFAGLTGAYTLLGILGGWLLWRSGKFAARRWLLLAALVIFLRLAFFATLENPEPRYVVEFFPFLSVLGGIAIAHVTYALKKPQMHTNKHG